MKKMIIEFITLTLITLGVVVGLILIMLMAAAILALMGWI